MKGSAAGAGVDGDGRALHLRQYMTVIGQYDVYQYKQLLSTGSLQLTAKP